ncbi:MAG: hypothetical protein OXE41_08770 [Gammaproteobacteria bacterium]|nr:hypothetical protein [Gammaproteobacteria bacterium]MCY4275468.1 hypothetical protein [Gammaproteobacteria bacterium]
MFERPHRFQANPDRTPVTISKPPSRPGDWVIMTGEKTCLSLEKLANGQLGLKDYEVSGVV